MGAGSARVGAQGDGPAPPLLVRGPASRARRIGVRVAAAAVVLGLVTLGAVLAGALPPQSDGIGRTVRATATYSQPCGDPLVRAFGAWWYPTAGELGRRVDSGNRMPGAFTRHDADRATFVTDDGRRGELRNGRGFAPLPACVRG